MLALRSLLFQAFFWTWSTLINLAYIPALLMAPKVTLNGQEIWARVSLWGLKWIAGTDYEVRGRENIPAGPVLIAAKHLSMWETLAMHVLVHHPATVMKRQLLMIPGYGWYSRHAKMIVIDRDAGAPGDRDGDQAWEHALPCRPPSRRRHRRAVPGRPARQRAPEVFRLSDGGEGSRLRAFARRRHAFVCHGVLYAECCSRADRDARMVGVTSCC